MLSRLWHSGGYDVALADLLEERRKRYLLLHSVYTESLWKKMCTCIVLLGSGHMTLPVNDMLAVSMDSFL